MSSRDSRDSGHVVSNDEAKTVERSIHLRDATILESLLKRSDHSERKPIQFYFVVL